MSQEDHTKRAVCKKVGKKGEEFYQCKVCALVNDVLLCFDCFQEEKHAMHDYRTIDGENKTCNCGNAEFLQKDCFCSRHERREWHPSQ